MSLAQPCIPVVGARLGDESGEVVAEAEAEARLSGISAEVGACRLGPCCGKHHVVLRGATVTGVAGAAGKNRHLQRGEPQDRVDAYSGRPRIDSVPGQGTHIRAALPCG